MSNPKSPVVVNALGHRCPVPTLRLRRALESTPPGGTVQLLADDPMAKVDVPHFAAEAGHEVLGVEARDQGLAFTLRKKASPATG